MDNKQHKSQRTSKETYCPSHTDAKNKKPKFRSDASMLTWLGESPEHEHWNSVSKFSDDRAVLAKTRALL